MIQIRKFRTRDNGPLTAESEILDQKLSQNVLIESVAELFLNIEKYLDQIPLREQYNLHYTLGHTTGERVREWVGQDVVPFDIDGIGDADPEKIASVAIEALGLDPAKTGVVFSGHGVHLLLQLTRPIPHDDHKYFGRMRLEYAGLVATINEALHEAGLPGQVDQLPFRMNATLRMPLTKNVKLGFPDTMVRLHQRVILPQASNLDPLAPGVSVEKKPWEVEKKDTISKRELASIKVDSPAVEHGCLFLSHAKANQNDMTEAQWYAMLGIVGYLPEGDRLAHEYSREHRTYSKGATDRKLEQATQLTGPRTCKNISTLFDGCRACPHFAKGLKTPVMIRSEEFIATRDTGFCYVQEKGHEIAFDDLRKYFEETHPYFASSKSKEVYIFDGKKYASTSEGDLQSFAMDNVKTPKGSPRFADCKEFEERLRLTNRRLLVDFKKDASDLVNFQNGVYSISEGELYPHSPSYGLFTVLPYAYDPEARCPAFLKFLKEVTLGDEIIQENILEFIGYAYCDHTYSIQIALILLGDGANGKSTLINVIKALFGKEAYSSLNIQSLGNELKLSQLAHKLINIADELPSYTLNNSDDFKRLFGGEIQYRDLYKNYETMLSTTKLLFAGNTLPSYNDSTHGLLRKLHILPFDARFEAGANADPYLLDKLLLELPGIFNVCVEAYKNLKARKHFRVSPRSHELIQEYKGQLDPVTDFVREELKFGDWTAIGGSELSLDELQDRFETWLRKENIPHRLTRKAFASRLGQAIPKFKERITRRKVGGRLLRVVRGASFTEGVSEEIMF